MINIAQLRLYGKKQNITPHCDMLLVAADEIECLRAGMLKLIKQIENRDDLPTDEYRQMIGLA